MDKGFLAGDMALFNKVISQKRDDSNKIYSLHEPHVQRISKGKEHKNYVFGSKVSIIATKNSGVIIGALNIEKNDYDAQLWILHRSNNKEQRAIL